MAFLRSGKFFRFLSAGKNLVNFREYESAHQLPLPCVCSAKNFATISAINPSDSLDKSLKRLDNDVRRSGRISRRDLEEILEEIRTNKSATSSQSLLVIRCCGNLVPEEMPEARTKMVQEIWKTLSKLNVPMDISHYNALLRVYLENEYKFSPTEFLADLQAKGVEPNRVTYQRIISGYCQQGDISGATQILEFMREKQLPVNEIVFNALIMGHSNCDDLESAAGILGFMAQAGLQPSADTYTTLLCGFARTGDMDSINKYIEQSEQQEISLLDKDLLEVIYALAVNGHEAKIDEVLARMKKSYGYNQDVVNVILRLINRAQESAALKMLKTMPRGTRTTGEHTDTGNFLIRQLVKANRPVEQILKICNELEELNLNTQPIMVAVEAALAGGHANTSKVLLKEMNTKGVEVRQHYFWPVFCAAKSEQDVVDTITLMQKDFNMSPDNQTLREYIIPKILKNDDYLSVIHTLNSLGITQGRAAAAVASVAITNHHVAKAAEVMNQYDSYYAPPLYLKSLSNALHYSDDYESCVRIIRRIVDNIGKNRSQKQDVDENEENEGSEGAIDSASSGSARSLKEKQADIVGDFLMGVLIFLRSTSNRVEVLQNLLQRFVDEGLSINSVKAQRIQDRLGEDLTDELSALLAKLASGELEPIVIERQRAPKADYSSRSPEEWQRLIARLDERGENTKGFKREWLISAIRSKDIPKTEEIVSQLKSEGYVLGSGVFAQLIELYSSEDKPDEALALLKTVRETDPEFVPDEVKMIKVVQSLVNADRTDEAIAFAMQHQVKDPTEEKGFNHQSTCWRLLNSLAEKGKDAELTKLFDVLVASGYIIPNNSLLGPLIKVHLLKDDVKQAIDKFEEVCQKYRATPWKNEIARRLIQAEDAVNLQRITDLSTEVHGEVNSLYDLVFTFIECGRVRQARKILETPGLQTRQGRINVACERYLNESMPTALEGLIEATKDLNHIDRAEIYHTLLKTYVKEATPEKALELWTTMQEEGVTPTDAFLIQLADFLKKNGLEVPFHVPAQPEPVKRESAVTTKVTTRKEAPVKASKAPARKERMSNPEIEATANATAFRKALKAGNVDEILSTLQNLTPTDKVSITHKSLALEALVRADNMTEATKLVFQLLDEKTHPIPRHFCFYLNKLAINGDTATLEKVGQHLTPETKKLASFDNRMCHSFVANGKADDYLNILESVIDNAKTPDELKAAEESFPRGGASGIIEKNPELIPRFEKIAMKYLDKQILGPMNVLWMNYFIMNDPRGDEMFKQYLTTAPRLMFQRVLVKARENQDEVLVQKLIELLPTSKVSEGAIGNAYSCLLDIYASKENADACLATITACIKDVCLENVNNTALNRAKQCVEKSGKSFPHITTGKKTSNQKDSSSSSSSSSSDDEVTRKNKAAASP